MILHFLIMKVESSSETSRSASNSTYDERAVLYSFEIDDDGVEISHLYHFGAVGPRCPYPCFLAKVVQRGEIFINPSDLKHVVGLLGCIDGLGMVITTRVHRWDAFYGLY